MNISETRKADTRSVSAQLGSPLMFVGVSLTAIVGAFVLANSSLQFDTKTKAFSAVIVAFLIYCAVAVVGREEGGHWWRWESNSESCEEIEQKLYSIEEAALYFGGSLGPADMFRLMASRVRDIVPFDMCVLFMIDRAESRMRIVQTHGEGAENLRGVESDLASGLSGISVANGSVQIDRGLNRAGRALPAEAVRGFETAAALPLKHNGEIFAVLKLFAHSKTAFEDKAGLLEAVSERVTPMVLGSLSFEQNVSRALTDPLTHLPNERAFFMIVENQLAESQRNREGRPLSLLAVDIKYFAEVNQRFGHAAGDRILNFVARKIKEQLRQMDFFARSSNDEFLIILPTAAERVAAEVVARIHTEFVECKYAVNDTQSVQIDLNFGMSTFWKDGETAQSLLAVARERKEQSKNVIPSKVVWFPKEYVN